MPLDMHALPTRAPWAHEFGIIDPGYTDGLVGAWRFGRQPGMSNEEMRQVCKTNKAPYRGVAGPQSAMLKGAPVVQDEWFEFAAGTDAIMSGLKKPQVGELDRFCIIAVVATDQNPINSTATRPFFCGWYGQNSGQGTGLIASALTTYQMLGYESAVSAVNASMSTSGAAQGVLKWRAISISRFGTTQKIQNLNADATTNVVTATIAARFAGGRPFSIGSAHNIYTGGAIAKVHAILVYELPGDADLSDGVKAGIVNALRAGTTLVF